MSAPTIHGPAPAQHRDALVVLTRIPRPGFGKSRLAATIGIERAHVLACAFLGDTLRLLDGARWQGVLAFMPPEATTEAAKLAIRGTAIVAQPDGDLGVRILAALDHALRGAERAVLIGSDTPDLPAELIGRAFDALDHADVVIGPAGDGGFYLIGLHRMHSGMFHHIAWSTPTVYARTVANLQRLGLHVSTIETWEDVDDATSLEALARRLELPESNGRAPATRAVLAALAEPAVA